MWNTLAITISGQDGFGSPMYGTGGWTYDEAKTEVQTQLEMLAKDDPRFSRSPEAWSRGVEDDTISLRLAPGTMVIYAVYEYPEDEDPVHKALEWLDAFSKFATGRPAQMIIPPSALGGTPSP